MRHSLLRIRVAFIMAVAFCAATTGDAVVEAISNSGFLWRGRYTDNSSLDLLPMFALSVVALLGALYLVVRSRVELGSLRALAFTTSRALRLTTVVRLVPAIFAFQLATLFVMETAEQMIVYGHSFGGTLWLGAPIVFAVAMHFALGSLSALSLAVALSFSADQVVRIVRILVRRLARAATQSQAAFRWFEQFRQDHQWLLRTSLSDRGPPAFGLPLG